jgi:hypothetical protein
VSSVVERRREGSGICVMEGYEWPMWCDGLGNNRSDAAASC